MSIARTTRAQPPWGPVAQTARTGPPSEHNRLVADAPAQVDSEPAIDPWRCDHAMRPWPGHLRAPVHAEGPSPPLVLACMNGGIWTTAADPGCGRWTAR